MYHVTENDIVWIVVSDVLGDSKRMTYPSSCCYVGEIVFLVIEGTLYKQQTTNRPTATAEELKFARQDFYTRWWHFKTPSQKIYPFQRNFYIYIWFLPTRTIEIIALGLNCPSILNLNWSLKIMARRRTTTNKIVSIRLTSHGTRRNLFSAETPKMCKNLYLIDYSSRY